MNATTIVARLIRYVVTFVFYGFVGFQIEHFVFGKDAVANRSVLFNRLGIRQDVGVPFYPLWGLGAVGLAIINDLLNVPFPASMPSRSHVSVVAGSQGGCLDNCDDGAGMRRRLQLSAWQTRQTRLGLSQRLDRRRILQWLLFLQSVGAVGRPRDALFHCGPVPAAGAAAGTADVGCGALPTIVAGLLAFSSLRIVSSVPRLVPSQNMTAWSQRLTRSVFRMTPAARPYLSQSGSRRVTWCPRKLAHHSPRRSAPTAPPEMTMTLDDAGSLSRHASKTVKA